MRARRVFVPLTAAALALGGCQPDSVTEARDQLGRGPERTVQYVLPLTVDTFTIGEFLAEGSDTATTPSGIRAVRFEPDSIMVDVGDRLEFDDLTFDAFTFSYDQMLETQEVSTSLAVPGPPPGAGPSMAAAWAFAVPDTVEFDTPDGSSVTGATIASGWVVRTLTNGTNCPADVEVALVDAVGDTVAAFPDVVVAAANVVVDSADASGAVVSQFVSVEPTADFGACVPNPGGTVSVDVTFRPMTLASVDLQNVNETFTDTYAALASEDRLQAIDTVRVGSGSLDVTVANRLPVVLMLDLTVQGITSGGLPIQRTFNVPAAPGDGSTTQATLTIDLAGTTITPPSVLAVVQGTATAPNATISPLVTTDAVVVGGDGALTVQELVGVLDPAETPELTVSVESAEPVDADAIDFGDFEDAVRGSTINDATLTFSITNGLSAPITLDNYQVGLALTDGAGNPRRDGGGNIIYETDAMGAPIVLTLAQPGQTLLPIPAGGAVNVLLPNAVGLLDRLVHLLLDDSSAALVGAGSAVVGDGTSQARISATDAITINLDMLVGLDITIPDTGVVFTATTVVDGLGLEDDDADDLASRLIEARATSNVSNGIPYGVEVTIALIGGDFGEDADVFTIVGHTILPVATLGAASVDAATGRATAPTTGVVEEVLTGASSRPLFGESMTATVRIRIRPPAGSGGRGAVVSGDPLVLDVRASVSFRSGGSQ